MYTYNHRCLRSRLRSSPCADYNEGTIHGTKVCQELRAAGFTGMVIIVSANDEPEARAQYLSAGANGSFGKGVGGGVSKMVDYLATVHRSKNQ